MFEIDGVAAPSAVDVEAAEDERFIAWMLDLLRALNPNHAEPNRKRWCREIRLMRERDGRTRHDIAALFRWANQHHFWQTNILSPAKLRARWDQLTIARNAESRSPSGPGASAPIDRRCAYIADGTRCTRRGTSGNSRGEWHCDEHAETLERERALANAPKPNTTQEPTHA